MQLFVGIFISLLFVGKYTYYSSTVAEEHDCYNFTIQKYVPMTRV